MVTTNPDFGGLVSTYGWPVAILIFVITTGVPWAYHEYRKAVDKLDKAYEKASADKDEEIRRLEARNAKLEERIFRVLDKAEYVADLAGAPQSSSTPVPSVRRRRQDV